MERGFIKYMEFQPKRDTIYDDEPNAFSAIVEEIYLSELRHALSN
jgi:hypothetical protein